MEPKSTISNDPSTIGASWAACIATLNRPDVLMVALGHLLCQTRPPAEVVVVDASDDWEDTREQAKLLFAERPEIRLDYLTSEIRSSATQRNLAISRANADIVFMIDDDSFLHADCASELLSVYDADVHEQVVGVGANLVDENPAESEQDLVLDRKETGRTSLAGLSKSAMSTALGRWIGREILFQSADMLFMRYDEPRQQKIPPNLAQLDVETTVFMPGSGMSFRRSMGQVEQYDTTLRYYAAFEDLDLAYRLARHGAILKANRAKLHHFEAAAGRVKRTKVITFQLLNMAVFLKRHADSPEKFKRRYIVMLWRRLLAEFLKDGLSRRWGFPQVAGVITAMQNWKEIWRRNPSELDTWYPQFQKRILNEIR